MKKFFKYLLATFLGGILALLFLVVVLVVISIASFGSKNVEVKEKSILWLDLNGPIVERYSSNPLQEIFEGFGDGPLTEGLNQVLKNIEKAKRDEKIKGIFLDVGMLSTGYATIEEIRNALLDFKKSGKFVYAYGSVYTQKAYYLASISDKVYLTPSGMVEFGGIHSQRIFFKSALAKLGIEMQVFKVGKFKSAVEPFIEEKMSDAAREQTQVYIDAIWDKVLSNISESRGVRKDVLDAFADEMPMFLDPQELVKRGLVDSLIYKDELLDKLKILTGIDQKDDLNTISNKDYASVFVKKESSGIVRDKIAVIYAVGEIDGTGSDGIRSNELSRTIREARRDSSIKAIVLRINSPGGSALGSEIIWREVKLAKESKPVVVSMGDLAASGGYYIACAADCIVAQPTTLTGSIGVFGMIPNTAELMDKIGVSFDGVKTNKFADMPAINRPFRPEERDLMQAYVGRIYQLFTQRCADGRNTSQTFIDSVGQGRVWAGENAVSIKLVDKIGGLNDAISVAKQKAKLDKYRIVELPEEKDPIDMFMKGIGGDAKMWAMKSFMGEYKNYMETLQSLKGSYPLQARLPYDINMN